ncbi:hypothetical protein ACFLZO_00545 [Patescibacteria group bacterium]
MKYLPEFADAKIDFIPTNAKGGETVDDPDFVYVGVGRGEFDEHKGDIGECATSLVYTHVKEKVSLEPKEVAALDKLVAWVLEEDMGRLSALPLRQFSIPSIIQGQYRVSKRDSHKVAELTLTILDAVFDSLKELVNLEKDWENRIEFDSRFGKAVAIETGARDIDSYAYIRGFDLAVYVNRQHDYFNVRARADAENVDLSSVYDRLKELEPQAGWYIHHSKKMLICGGDLEPGAVLSKLRLDELIDTLR